jgi:hypothetical protein
VVTGDNDRANAVKAIAGGAYDFHQKPADPELLTLLVDRAQHVYELERENQALQRAQENMPLDNIIAVSPQMLKVCRTVEKIAPTDITTLLLGASGTGKERFARALHDLSPRANGERMVAINCAAIPDTLLESELFGYEKGRLHRRQSADHRQDRARQRRHAVPRRDRRPADGTAGQAAALPAGAGGRAPRRSQGDPGRCARGLRDAPEPRAAHRRGQVPRGPLLPRQRNGDQRFRPCASATGMPLVLAKAFLSRFAGEQRDRA